MRRLLPSLLLLAACTSVRSIPRDQLMPIEHRAVGDGLVVRTTETWNSRLDPRSRIRFFNKQLEPTDWLDADTLRVANGWVYIPWTINILAYTESIAIRGLDRAALTDLAAARPFLGTALEIEEDGTAIVQARGTILRTWVDHFIDAVAIRLAERVPGGLGARADHLRYDLGGEPLGSWTFTLTRYGASTAAGETLLDHLAIGLGTVAGWSFRDMAYAEIEDFSGAKTYGAIFGVATIVALAVATGRKRVEIDFSRPHPLGTWEPELAPPANRSAPLLFTSAAVRKTVVMVDAQAELAVDVFSATQLYDGGAATVILGQAFEVGAGGGHLLVRRGTSVWQGGLAFFRFGANLPVDAAHRYSLPLVMDIGGGGGEALGAFWRMRTGVQRRITEHAYVGASIAPTYFNWKHGGPSRDARTWTLAAGVEAGLRF